MSLNQIIDQDRLSSLVVDNTLNLKARNLRVFGDVTAGTFNGVPLLAQTSTSIPYEVFGHDGVSDHGVTGVGVIGNMTFVKIGRVVQAILPEFTVSSFLSGGANQSLRIKFNSVLPASLIPAAGSSIAVRVESAGANLTTFGIAHLSTTGDFIEINSNASTGTFTVSCGLSRRATITYITASS